LSLVVVVVVAGLAFVSGAPRGGGFANWLSSWSRLFGDFGLFSENGGSARFVAVAGVVGVRGGERGIGTLLDFIVLVRRQGIGFGLLVIVFGLLLGDVGVAHVRLDG
jgi:hypothetical protein